MAPPALLGTASLQLPCGAAASREPRHWLTLAESAVSGAGYEWSWLSEGKIEFDTSVPTGYHHRDYFLQNETSGVMFYTTISHKRQDSWPSDTPTQTNSCVSGQVHISSSGKHKIVVCVQSSFFI